MKELLLRKNLNGVNNLALLVTHLVDFAETLASLICLSTSSRAFQLANFAVNIGLQLVVMLLESLPRSPFSATAESFGGIRTVRSLSWMRREVRNIVKTGKKLRQLLLPLLLPHPTTYCGRLYPGKSRRIDKKRQQKPVPLISGFYLSFLKI